MDNQFARRSAGAGDFKEGERMSELKPCPFCGESKLLYSGGCGFRYDDDDNQIRLFRVHCRTCKGRTGLFESLDEAVEAWNRRTNSTTIQPPALSTNLASLGKDCISRQAAIDAARDWYEGLICGSFKGLEKRLRALPSAQPEIIRCRNCKFASGDSRICMKFGHSPIGELDFCAWAERRTDE